MTSLSRRLQKGRHPGGSRDPVPQDDFKEACMLDPVFRRGDGLAAFLLVGLLFISSLAFAATNGSISAETLTLKQSIERALKNNPALLSAKTELSVARTQVRQAKSLFLPKVNLNMDYIRYRHETIGLIPPEMGNVVLETPAASEQEIEGNPARNLYYGRLGFVQTLYAGGRLDALYGLSKANRQRAESAFNSLKQQVEFETATNFFGLAAAREKKTAFNEMFRELSRMTRDVSGSHSKLAIGVVQSDFRKRFQDLEQTEEKARFEYLRSMGVELFNPVEVEGVLEVKSLEQDLQSMLAWAKQNRSELKETQIQEEVDKLSVNLSLSERYPVFLLGGGMELRNQDFPLDQTNWNAVLSMNIPVFDGFSSRARVKESRYRADQGRLRRAQLEDQVDWEVRSADRDLQHWSAELGARQSEKNNLTKQWNRYFGPSGRNANINERLDFARWYLDATLSVIDAKQQICNATVRLMRATGRSLLDQ